MRNKKEIQEYFESRYYNKDSNYNKIVSKIKEEELKEKSLLKVIAVLLITVLGTTGIVWATTQIYNNNIKKKEELDTTSIFRVKEGPDKGTLHNYKNSMTYSEETDLFYKIITNGEEYEEYKSIEDELPEASEVDFNNNFLVIVAQEGIPLSLHEIDLTIAEINADETTTHIVLRTKENPNYDKTSITIYAIVDKSVLRNEISLKIDTSKYRIKDITKIEELPNNYNKEEAIKDGCMVINIYQPEESEYLKGDVLSENKYAIDELIEKSEKGIESYIRILCLRDNQEKNICDIQYKDKLFMINTRELDNTKVNTYVCKHITKTYFENNTYIYGGYTTDNTSQAMGETMIILVTLD